MRIIFALALFLTLGLASAEHPSVLNCTLHWKTQFLDHFSWKDRTFQQRYFVYDKWFRPGGPIFFYVGNEANVELYANWTGLMWDNGEAVGALLVFAEHRYFGKSLPCPGGFRQCGDHLSTEQAMADYAALIVDVRDQYPGSSATVAFGGSYGGMLAAWMRMRYPALVNGAIASSAPIGCMSPSYKGESYWAVVTRDATAAGGAAPQCSVNVNNALLDAQAAIATVEGRAMVQRIFKLCAEPTAEEFGLFVQAAFDSLAMGNYPFPTYYIAGEPGHPAPAWPMRVACKFMATARPSLEERLTDLYHAVSVVDNITGTATCYNTSGLNPSVYSPEWDFMVCTEHVPNEQPYFAATGMPNDMFYKQPVYTKAKLNAHCQKTFGKTPRYGEVNYGLGVDSIAASSNIVFANGLLDPWHSGGILKNLSSSIIALIIPDGAHHLDLFFATSEDSQAVRDVRRSQMANIRKWMAESPRH